MKKTTTRKIEKISHASLSESVSLQGLSALQDSFHGAALRKVFGKVAVQDALQMQQRIHGQYALATLALGSIDQGTRDDFNTKNTEIFGKTLRYVFPSLTAAQRKEVKAALQNNGLIFSGQSIKDINWKKAPQ